VPAIERIHWGLVGARSHGDEPGALFAIWPEPVDHDACFEEAEFVGTNANAPDDAPQIVQVVVTVE
jgi:hypothetical protein